MKLTESQRKSKIDAFIQNYSECILNESAAIFVGAGISYNAGYHLWSEFLKDRAKEIGLDVKKEESDLISLAQYYVNKNKRNKLDNEIRAFFGKNHKLTKNHNLLAQLPIKDYWTTNYDSMMERALEKQKIEHSVISKDKDIVLEKNSVITIHKMHGDASNPQEAIIIKADYEKYYDTHEMMLAKLKGEMCSKTFLFLGYSFNDPNINHILARIRKVYDKDARRHYCIMKEVPEKDENGNQTEDYEYKCSKQECQIKDFENYGIEVICIKEHCEITEILEKIKQRVYVKNVVICGSFKKGQEKNFSKFAQGLAAWLIEEDYKIHCGYGRDLGQYVVKGALEGYKSVNKKDFSKNLILFPVSKNNSHDDNSQMRKNMIANTHITIIIGGTDGVKEEAKISEERGNLIIPIASTGGAAKGIWDVMFKDKAHNFSSDEFKLLNQNINQTEMLENVKNVIVNYVSKATNKK